MGLLEEEAIIGGCIHPFATRQSSRSTDTEPNESLLLHLKEQSLALPDPRQNDTKVRPEDLEQFKGIADPVDIVTCRGGIRRRPRLRCQ